MAMPSLAGTLEKRKHWRKDWTSRFFVLRPEQIDYFLTAPAFLNAENAENLRGSIPLDVAAPTEEPHRPHCIRMGNELISCATSEEQKRWIEAINSSPAVAAKSRFLPSDPAVLGALDGREEPGLLLIPPEEKPRPLRWHEPFPVLLSSRHSYATVLFFDGSGGSSSSSTESGRENSARRFCRLPLFDAKAGEADFPVMLLSNCNSSNEHCHLRARIHANRWHAVTEHPRILSPIGCLIVAVALLAAGNVVPGICTVVVVILLLLWEARAPIQPQQRQVTFSIERLAQRATVSPAVGAPVPLWVGKWKLDKSCSEKYEPVLADMGVNYLIRKAADSIKSVLIISVSATHVTIHVKTLVAVEDTIPLDGSWTTKDVPPGSRMRGQMRVAVTKNTASQLEMYSEFPEGEGDLRDTLTVHEDGNSFSRVVVRGQLSVTRVFRRDNTR